MAQCGPPRFAELVDRFVENGRNPGQARLRVIFERIHFHEHAFHGDPAAAVAAPRRVLAATKQVCRCSQPPNMTSRGKPWRCPSARVHKDGLSHVLGQMRVAADQSNLPSNTPGRGNARPVHERLCFRSPLGVIRQQIFGCPLIAYPLIKTPPVSEIRQKSLGF